MSSRAVWTIYNLVAPGWLTDNDTLIEWVTDVADARWFDSPEAAADWLAENGVDALVIRLR